MYERSAIVLETYFGNILGLDEKVSLKTVYSNYKEMLKEIKQYQEIIRTEDKAIEEYDNIANEINSIQKEQKKIYESNIELEESRNQLFSLLDETPEEIKEKMIKIEEKISVNNDRLEVLREEFVQALAELTEKQAERNRYSRERRGEERIYLQILEKTEKSIKLVDVEVLKRIKELINGERKGLKKEILQKLIDNGQDERIPFYEESMKVAVDTRTEIAKKEAACYLIIYERARKLLADINTDEDQVRLEKYKKKFKEVAIKLEFLKAQKKYIISFLDNERIVAINGIKVHNRIMEEACENFELDMRQFNNLYELILREIAGKATRKAYVQLYNKEYLKNIEEKERNFEEETTNIKIRSGTIISFNYWRIQEIKNVYEVFIKEVSEKFDKDLTDFKLAELEEPEISDEKIMERFVKVETDEKDDIIASILGENGEIEEIDKIEEEPVDEKEKYLEEYEYELEYDSEEEFYKEPNYDDKKDKDNKDTNISEEVKEELEYDNNNIEEINDGDQEDDENQEDDKQQEDKVVEENDDDYEYVQTEIDFEANKTSHTEEKEEIKEQENNRIEENSYSSNIYNSNNRYNKQESISTENTYEKSDNTYSDGIFTKPENKYEYDIFAKAEDGYNNNSYEEENYNPIFNYRDNYYDKNEFKFEYTEEDSDYEYDENSSNNNYNYIDDYNLEDEEDYDKKQKSHHKHNKKEDDKDYYEIYKINTGSKKKPVKKGLLNKLFKN